MSSRHALSAATQGTKIWNLKPCFSDILKHSQMMKYLNFNLFTLNFLLPDLKQRAIRQKKWLWVPATHQQRSLSLELCILFGLSELQRNHRIHWARKLRERETKYIWLHLVSNHESSSTCRWRKENIIGRSWILGVIRWSNTLFASFWENN